MAASNPLEASVGAAAEVLSPDPTRTSDAATAEVSGLRSELLAYSGRVADLTKYAVTASVTLVTVSLSPPLRDVSWIVALLPLPALVPAALLICNTNAQIVRIATYLRVFHGDRFPWERRLNLFRQAAPARWPSHLTGVVMPIMVTGWVCVPLSWLLYKKNAAAPSIGGPYLVLLAAFGWLLFSGYLLGWMTGHRLGTVNSRATVSGAGTT